jgi:hypothetical protein
MKKILLIGFLIITNVIFQNNNYYFSQCTHTISLTDTWGDGWNGGTVNVTVNGVDVLTGLTFASGSGPVNHTFSANNGDVIAVIRTNDGSYPEEMRVAVSGGCGTVISTIQPAVSPGVSGTGNCVSGNPTVYGVNSWIGYVYATHNGNNPPANAFTTTYRGFVTEAENFDRNYGTGGPGGGNVCGSYTNDFAIRYRMNKSYPAGVYTFTIGADDGVRLSVDGGATWLIDDWSNHGYRTTTGSAYLNGSTNLVLEYYERGSDSRVSFNITNGETPNMFISHGQGSTKYTACSGTFYDSGGSGGSTTNSGVAGNYSDGEAYTVTFFPTAAIDKVVLTFSSLSMENCCDWLRIYDGNSIAAPMIGQYQGTSNPGTITSTAADGSITIRFTSDGSVNRAGWAAAVSCFNPCVPVIVDNSILANASAGPVDICLGQSVTISSSGGKYGQYVLLGIQ